MPTSGARRRSNPETRHVQRQSTDRAAPAPHRRLTRSASLASPPAAGRRERAVTKFLTNRFELLAEWISIHLGHPYAFTAALALVVIWAVTGPVFDFSDTWQLVINTGTTICTFLMVFLLQNTGNRTIEEMQERLRSMERLNRDMLAELRAARAAHDAPALPSRDAA